MSNTPIQKLDNSLYIKRDDLIPYSFGGNKARKAKLFFEEIDNNDYDCVVTYGSSSSNHCRVVANMAAQRSIECYIISPLEEYIETFNSRLINLFGAEVMQVPVNMVHETIEKRIVELKAQGKKPYFIAGGGHGNIGTQAYVDCYNEIKSWEEENNIHFDYIFHASGTGTTQAGLISSNLINGDNRKIVGISIARKLPRGRDIVVESVQNYLVSRKIDIANSLVEESTIFIDDYTGAGYGKDSVEISDTIKNCMIDYGIPLDKTYTGKAFYGMIQYIKKNRLADKIILFIHTGGTPLFFDAIKE